MNSTLCKTLVLTLVAAITMSAAAISFVPPNDTVGAVYTVNDNDGYDQGRGIVVAPTAATQVDSIGILVDLTGIELDYTIYQLTAPTGIIRVGAIPILNGSILTSTSGLEWVDVPTGSLSLAAGSFYEIT